MFLKKFPVNNFSPSIYKLVLLLGFLLISNGCLPSNADNVVEKGNGYKGNAPSKCSHNCSALLIIDVQNCFVENGTLPIKNGSRIVPLINEIRYQYRNEFNLVVLSKDWHCPNHISFGSQHPSEDSNFIDLKYDQDGQLCKSDIDSLTKYSPVDCTNRTVTSLKQYLWPDHCIQNTTDSNIVSHLNVKSSDVIINKGNDCKIDSYSAFYDNGGFRQTELNFILSRYHIGRVFVVGLATDYCVKFTSFDAWNLGYKTYVIRDAVRGVLNESSEKAFEEMKNKGIVIIDSSELKRLLKPTNNSDRLIAFIWNYIILVCLGIVNFNPTLKIDN